jgi:hypothetical protein
MTLEADFYRVRIRFGKLYADPRIFDSPPSFAREYLQSKGLSRNDAQGIYETTEDVVPLDDNGRPALPAGTGKFHYQGKMLRSEYIQGANIQLEYSDFGSGFRPDEHRRAWAIGRWDDLSFEMKDLQHQHVNTGVASFAELYGILKGRAHPTTMATVELSVKAGGVFNATVQYLADHIGRLAQPDGGTVEVYAARQLSNQERKAIEARLGQEATASTVYIILSTTTPAE